MGLRFQRRIRVFKGFNINLSKSGIGLSLGPRGAKVGIDSKGKTYGSVGIPGTGLSYRSQLNPRSEGNDRQAEPSTHYAPPAYGTPGLGRRTEADESLRTILWILVALIVVVFGIAVMAFISNELSRAHQSSVVPAPRNAQVAAPAQMPAREQSAISPPPAPGPAVIPSAQSQPRPYARSYSGVPSPMSERTQSVSGYYRKDGTYVRAYRRKPRSH